MEGNLRPFAGDINSVLIKNELITELDTITPGGKVTVTTNGFYYLP